MAILSFFQKSWRWLFFFLLAPIFLLVIPFFCYYLDGVDRKRDYTLGYFCTCRKR
jgi:hypothetical protein